MFLSKTLLYVSTPTPQRASIICPLFFRTYINSFCFLIRVGSYCNSIFGWYPFYRICLSYLHVLTQNRHGNGQRRVLALEAYPGQVSASSIRPGILRAFMLTSIKTPSSSCSQVVLSFKCCMQRRKSFYFGIFSFIVQSIPLDFTALQCTIFHDLWLVPRKASTLPVLCTKPIWSGRDA